MCCRETMGSTEVYKMVLTIIPCLFIPLPHFQYREDIYAHPCFQAFPKQFTNDYLSNHQYVRRRGRYSYNTHGSILKCSWRRRRMDGQSSTGTGLKLQRPSTSMKAQYSPSTPVVFQMRFICLFTVYDSTFQRFLMLHVKLGAVV